MAISTRRFRNSLALYELSGAATTLSTHFPRTPISWTLNGAARLRNTQLHASCLTLWHAQKGSLPPRFLLDVVVSRWFQTGLQAGSERFTTGKVSITSYLVVGCY